MYQPPPLAIRPMATRPTANVTDDYERWYMEPTNTNRMLLSLRSGLLGETTWALDRLCRLCNNDQFLFRSIPGLVDALFEWPEWYVAEAKSSNPDLTELFVTSPENGRKRRFALDSLFIMRNASVIESNGVDVAQHKKTKPLILATLHNLLPTTDANSEFLLHAIEILHLVAPTWTIPALTSPEQNPISPLIKIVGSSSNRPLIIASLVALHHIFSIPANSVHLTPDSLALEASFRYLPLLSDKTLVDACVNYLYTHLSHPPMAKAFLSHPRLTSVLRLLVNHILSEQQLEDASLPIGAPVETVPCVSVVRKPHEVTPEELLSLLALPEPNRCFEWMKMMFIDNPEGELTQVDFWTMYKERFSPHGEHLMLVASDVIKHVTLVFPRAQAMVSPGPPQRFIVRGVSRRMEESPGDRYKCRWDRDQCQVPPFPSAGNLYDHVLEHVNTQDEQEKECLWLTCAQPPVPGNTLRAHVLTHLPMPQIMASHPEQTGSITLPAPGYPHPVADATSRPPPPSGKISVSIRKPRADPSSSALTALLCVRVLFRTAHASTEAGPKLDADHFGFPGIIEEDGEDAREDVVVDEDEERALKRGKKAFMSIRRLLDGVQIKEEALMTWVTEMVQASM